MSGKNHKIADLSILLDETPHSYYWMGFLMADGHFYERGAIKLHLSEKDRGHIEKFRRFVKYNGKAKSCTMNAMNPIVHKIMEKFDITHLKTYEPCDLSWIKNRDLLFSLIVGMFDGDGNIRRRRGTASAIEMKLYGKWLSNLLFIENFLYDYLQIEKKTENMARLRKDGYALLLFSDRFLLAKMREAVIKLNLPVMKRKWDDINIQYKSRYKEYQRRLPQLLELVSQGITYSKIAKTLGITESAVTMAIYRERKKR